VFGAFGLKPHLSHSFKLSTDPHFVEKVRDVVGLYVDPPAKALVLCVDEKNQIQALDRTQPSLPMTYGMPETRTHDYRRYGTTTQFAALDVATGQVIGKLKRRHRSSDFIGYNMRRPLFKDVRVRRALGMAIDVRGIIEHVLSGEGKPATGPFYSTTPYFDPEVKPLPYDPQAALALLSEAGWRKNAQGVLEKDGRPFEFTLVTNNANMQRKAIMVIAQEAWRKLGINCRVQAFEWTVFLEEFVQKNDFDAYVLGWAGGAISPDKFSLFHSSNTRPYQPNYVGYQNPEVDELLIRIRETYDEAELIQLTQKLHRLLARDQPYTFIYEPIKPYVFDRRILRWQQSADGTEVAQKLATPRSGNIFQFLSECRKASAAHELAH
jgi:ABC-type transport system substrate-binding protein